jgi:hypothetical protein
MTDTQNLSKYPLCLYIVGFGFEKTRRSSL